MDGAPEAYRKSKNALTRTKCAKLGDRGFILLIRKNLMAERWGFEPQIEVLAPITV
jgi:hypothetical protein